ncbi:MAG: hypothetical protein QHH74_04290 [Spirochaetota bacterium]|nr:hypothetical protein [Spirochaetota bacterium]
MQQLQLAKLLNTHDHEKTLKEIKTMYTKYYSGFETIESCFFLIRDLFEGKFPGYQKCNTQYHDFQHTVDATVAAIRILDGYNSKRKVMLQNIAYSLMLASLLHDVGYIQEDWDTEGTGAKYTAAHVQRSVDFVKINHKKLGIDDEYIPLIALCIQSTGLSAKFEEMEFISREHKIAGAMMGTADLLGQMSDREYLEKLLFLYYEFKEAGIPGYTTEFDIIRKTIDFYVMTVKRMKSILLNVQHYCLYHFDNHYGIHSNLYMVAINRNIRYIKKIIADESTNFRHKLKRGDQYQLHMLSQKTLHH